MSDYYPYQSYGRGSADYSDMLPQLLGGWNGNNYATGNGSVDPRTGKQVGFNGGPMVWRSPKSGEWHGVEGPDMPWAAGRPDLVQARARFSGELQDPNIRARFFSLAKGEDASDPLPIMAGIMNRAAARGQTLSQAIGMPGNQAVPEAAPPRMISGGPAYHGQMTDVPGLAKDNPPLEWAPNMDAYGASLGINPLQNAATPGELAANHYTPETLAPIYAKHSPMQGELSQPSDLPYPFNDYKPTVYPDYYAAPMPGAPTAVASGGVGQGSVDPQTAQAVAAITQGQQQANYYGAAQGQQQLADVMAHLNNNMQQVRANGQMNQAQTPNMLSADAGISPYMQLANYQKLQGLAQQARAPMGTGAPGFFGAMGLS
jgi:hypothetical protein